MGESSWAGAETAIRAVLATGDLGGLVPLLAPSAWCHGTGPGGCRTREHVVEWIGSLPAGFRLLDLRRVADRIMLRVADPGGGEVSELVALDGEGRITAILDYPDAANAEADLDPPAADAVDPRAAVANALVPFLPVADIEASIEFYSLLGFGVTREHRPEGERVWAWLRCGEAEGRRAELMVAPADEPVDLSSRAGLFYLYTDDLDGLRDRLCGHGHLPSQIADGSPGPRRELRIDDPDGYCLMIAERE